MPKELYRYYWGLALLAIDEQDYVDAIEYYEKAIEIAKTHNIYTPDGGKVEALLYSALSELYITCGNFDLAIIADEMALKLLRAGDIENKFELYLRLADDYFLLKDYPSAKKYFDLANILEPNISERHLNTKFVKSKNSLEAAIVYTNGDLEEAAHLFYNEYTRSQTPSEFINIYVDVQNAASSYETSNIEKEMNLLSALQKEQGRRLVMQNTVLIISVLFIIVLIIILFQKIQRIKLQNSQRDALVHLSATDQLTQVKNRRKIMSDFDDMEIGTKCVALLDIDKFKEINDNFGHLVGDLVLKRIAEAIKTSIRENDDVGRYGGEEFLLLFDTDDLDSARAAAERIRTNIEQLRWDIPEIAVTVSIGLVHSKKIIGDQLLSEADLRLYTAKSSGRNKVISGEI